MIRPEIKAIDEWLRQVRREFHRYPELRFQEQRTAAKVAEFLHQFGLQVKAAVGGTGVVGLLRGAEPGPTFAIRADMDALPIQEESEAPYASCTPGVMHACGHDAHMAMALGAARILAADGWFRRQGKGQVKFIFQPGEEGGHGALRMIEDGVLEDPPVAMIVAAHVAPLLPAGTVGIYRREACAAADPFEIRIIGQGAHAAYPHLSRDPVAAGAQVITALQTIVSRNLDPNEGLVISVTRVQAGTATNIIPGEMSIAGTVRALRPQVRELALRRLEDLVQGVCSGLEVEAKLTLAAGYPPVINDEGASALVERVCRRILGEEGVKVRRPKFGSEDFAYFLDKVAGAAFDIGVANPDKKVTSMLHTPTFDIDEDVLGLGVEIYVSVVEEFFRERQAEP